MYYRPDDPIDYLEGCLKKARELGGPDKVRWDTFVGHEKKPLPPLNGGQTRRSLFRNGGWRRKSCDFKLVISSSKMRWNSKTHITFVRKSAEILAQLIRCQQLLVYFWPVVLSEIAGSSATTTRLTSEKHSRIRTVLSWYLNVDFQSNEETTKYTVTLGFKNVCSRLISGRFSFFLFLICFGSV